jgi:hypothetical protein
MSKPELYISTDVEADGPIPGINSMLSFASAAFTAAGEQVGTYSANLELLPGARPDHNTMEFWAREPAAWEACRKDCRDPGIVMPEYSDWVNGLGGKPVFVGYPVAYDFMWVYWYLIRFAGESPFSHSALDLKTYAMVLLGKDYRDSTKRNMPAAWFGKAPHTHVALDDAIGQGILFCNMLAERNKRLRTT